MLGLVASVVAMEKNPSLNIADSGKLQRSIITGHR